MQTLIKTSKYIFAFTLMFGFLNIYNFPIQKTNAQSKEQLQSEEKELERQIAEHQSLISEKQKQGKSLERDITILDTKIKKSETEIKLREKVIGSISKNISEKTKNISSLDEKLGREKIVMQTVLREIERAPENSLALITLGDASISSVLDSVSRFTDLKNSLNSSIGVVKNTKNELAQVKEQLIENKTEEQQLKNQQLSIKKDIEGNKTQKKTILTETKGQEKIYQKLVSDKQKRIKEIRTALYALRDGSNLQFGTLYDYAKQASSVTGVRTVFIMAILGQETNFGTNIGQCTVKDDAGTLVSVKNGDTRGQMRPDSVPHFKTITSALGRDYNNTKVSCAYEGYGGAMGISQFMPATWMGLESRIERAVGTTQGDPWNAYHAIMATALFVKDLGAGTQDATDEKNAACKYYSGRSCAKSTAASYYGKSVMSKIDDIQSKIDILQNK